MATKVDEKKNLEFSVIREDWSKYKIIDDDTIIKIKRPISDLMESRKEGKPHGLQFEFKDLFYRKPSSDDKGKPSKNLKITQKDIIKKLKFEKINELLNVYDVPEKYIILTLVKLISLTKTKKFDSTGNRIYGYHTRCAINIVNYPKE